MSASRKLIKTVNGGTVAMKSLPQVVFSEFVHAIEDSIESGARLSSLFAVKSSGSKSMLVAALALPKSEIGLISCEVGAAYRSLTPLCPQAHWFEREIYENNGILPEGHPWLKPIRFIDAGAGSKKQTIGVTEYYSVKGDEVHEVAVGPVHAGVIEPGHFRFQCHGETVLHLEISLGYQHRGIERAMIGGPNNRSIHYMETAAGDTTIGHATAYCMIMESLAGMKPTPRSKAIRAIAAELERLANHVGDLGALAGDIGYLPTMNYCGRIRGDALNMTALLCGNRFGRGLVVPGGVAWDIDDALAGKLLAGLDEFEADTKNAVDLMFDAPSVLARFEGTGTVLNDIAAKIGLVGVAARASGLDVDVRRDHPYGFYRTSEIEPAKLDSGDVYARAKVRMIEIENSIDIIRQIARSLPGGGTIHKMGTAAPDSMSIALTEGWRGEICHVAITGSDGRFAHYKMVDPSFHNWFGLAMSLRNQQISDFPLCNKSFNLSYCGHDL